MKLLSWFGAGSRPARVEFLWGWVALVLIFAAIRLVLFRLGGSYRLAVHQGGEDFGVVLGKLGLGGVAGLEVEPGKRRLHRGGGAVELLGDHGLGLG